MATKWVDKKSNETRYWGFQDDIDKIMKHNREQKEKIFFRARKVPMGKANLLADPLEILIPNQCFQAALAVMEPSKPPPKTYKINLNLGREKYTQKND
jgi:hypothetical protein